MSATQVQATTSGRLDLSPGDVIQVNIRELNASTNQTEKNEQLSGRYLITHISNVCNSDILNTQLTLFKYDKDNLDSFLVFAHRYLLPQLVWPY